MAQKTKRRFDTIVIGAGAGGLNIAGFMNKAGFRVLLIDKNDQAIGGDCLNFGCVPSKALLYAVKKYNNIDQIKNYIKSRQNIIRQHENADFFRQQGITVKLGIAKFTGKNSVAVDEEEYQSKKIVIATGSQPKIIDIPGLDQDKVYTNETIFDIDFLPKKLLVIGGGPIGIELGQAFLHLGSKVTVINNSERILNKEDPEISGLLQQNLEAEGMLIKNNADAAQVLRQENFNAVLLAVGRKTNFSSLNLECAGIETNERKQLVLDDFLRTTNKNVFAVGDAAGREMFTHVAELHASVIIKNLFSPFKKKLNTDNLSWVTFTDPQVAAFGLNEEKLKKRKISYQILKNDFRDDDRAIIENYPTSLAKIYIDKKGKILGGTMIAPNAGELIQELILAQSADLNVKDLFNKIYPYPTATRINKALVTQHFAKKLTPFTKKILRLLY